MEATENPGPEIPCVVRPLTPLVTHDAGLLFEPISARSHSNCRKIAELIDHELRSDARLDLRMVNFAKLVV